MTTDFDKAASGYDASFTHSVIGKRQRRHVYGFLSEVLEKHQPKTVLEVNCGTGEDAIWLANQNIRVTATDISEEMIRLAKGKSNAANPVFSQVDINELPKHFTGEKFDLIFSNFGGLNCLSEVRLELFFRNAAQLLSEKGQLILVIMPRNTIWEQCYFLAKADFKNIFRRKKANAIANVDGQKVITYYYDPKEAVTLARHYFDFRKLNPVGIFLPPSYLEPFFRNRPSLIGFLDKLEMKFHKLPFLAKHADHYFIFFQKR
ncbi:MAG TPA: class I SAM-dependent methyltransferase [Flavobacterium sp.]|nr:class I SAM-dependent methyltransferase [Flavobacterium sp.]